jgi:hypothetical protein
LLAADDVGDASAADADAADEATGVAVAAASVAPSVGTVAKTPGDAPAAEALSAEEELAAGADAAGLDAAPPDELPAEPADDAFDALAPQVPTNGDRSVAKFSTDGPGFGYS